MTANLVAKNLRPEAFVRQALTMGRTGFVLLYPDVQLLLVRLMPGSADLVEGLGANGSKTVSPDSTSVPLDFHTEKSGDITGLFRVTRSNADESSVKAWKALLIESPHYVVPIRKRPDADGMSSDRISVGRARNKDIVLRHGSVSKFHGWFQLDASRELCFMDVGSKNGTRVNAEAIEARKVCQLRTGDRLQIGNVECVLCSPDVLWSALHRGTVPRAAMAR